MTVFWSPTTEAPEHFSKNWFELIKNIANLCILFIAMQKKPPEVFYQKVVLKNFSKFTGNTCASVTFLIKLQAQVFSSEFWQIFKNIFTEHLRVTVSDHDHCIVDILKSNHAWYTVISTSKLFLILEEF